MQVPLQAVGAGLVKPVTQQVGTLHRERASRPLGQAVERAGAKAAVEVLMQNDFGKVTHRGFYWKAVRANIRDVDYLAGQLLVASPRLVDPNFVRTVVVLLNHDGQGAMGVVINRPSEMPVADYLPEWVDRLAPPDVVFHGGPVEQTVAIGLREGLDAGVNATPVPGLGMVNFGEDQEEVTGGRVRVFAGYAGWGPGQLEEEIEEESWITAPAYARDVFSAAPDELWAEVLSRQGGHIALLASMPLDPELN